MSIIPSRATYDRRKTSFLFFTCTRWLPGPVASCGRVGRCDVPSSYDVQSLAGDGPIDPTKRGYSCCVYTLDTTYSFDICSITTIARRDEAQFNLTPITGLLPNPDCRSSWGGYPREKQKQRGEKRQCVFDPHRVLTYNAHAATNLFEATLSFQEHHTTHQNDTAPSGNISTLYTPLDQRTTPAHPAQSKQKQKTHANTTSTWAERKPPQRDKKDPGKREHTRPGDGDAAGVICPPTGRRRLT